MFLGCCKMRSTQSSHPDVQPLASHTSARTVVDKNIQANRALSIYSFSTVLVIKLERRFYFHNKEEKTTTCS